MSLEIVYVVNEKQNDYDMSQITSGQIRPQFEQCNS